VAKPAATAPTAATKKPRPAATTSRPGRATPAVKPRPPAASPATARRRAAPPPPPTRAEQEAAVAERLDAGDLSGARLRLKRHGLTLGDLPAALRYAYAELTLRPGQPREQGQALLTELLREGGPLASLARVRLVEAMERAGRPGEALALLEGLEDDPGAVTLLHAYTPRRARLLRALDRPEELLRVTTPRRDGLWSELPLAELGAHRLWAARLLGQDALVEQEAARLLHDHPASPEAREELQAQDPATRLWFALDQGFQRRPPPGNRREEVRRLVQLAPAAQQAQLAPAFELVEGQLRLKAKAWEQAQTHFDRVVAKAELPELQARALLGRAISLRRRNLDLEAAASYRLLAQRYPQDPLAPRALEEAVRLARLCGEEELARLDLTSLLQYPLAPKQAAWARWTEAWLSLRTGQHGQAAEQFARLRREHPDAFSWSRGRLEEQALYWEGVARAESGQVSEGVQLWAELVARFPLTYYSYLAHARLHALDPERAATLRRPALDPEATASPPRAAELPLADRPEIRPILLFEEAGLTTLARRELRTLMLAKRLQPPEIDHLAALHREAGDETRAYLTERFFGRFVGYPEPGNLARWQLAHPRPFRELVEPAAASEGIDPHLVWAVMRQESAFQPHAKSGAGARGLMQLMPATARSVARQFGRRITDREIFDPALNIRLACRLLSNLLRQYDGNLMLALAAYNAGPGTVRKWRSRWGTLEGDQWAEEIPVAQAHGYAKQVVEALGVYQHLYGPPQEGGWAPMLRLSWARPLAAGQEAALPPVASR
jgi:soluble lytic murein transglycosylase-like protein/outer membrane protein assembly factor BamD (BamD/ComL family)